MVVSICSQSLIHRLRISRGFVNILFTVRKAPWDFEKVAAITVNNE
ncbi:hypothetical protein LPE509_02656 [Legionella pneumophila subsp. pneumophila LPE509]|nr:hypothetical protein LPE509_02656 [Legionella pneumophila subsp. pneumophila LPE509]